MKATKMMQRAQQGFTLIELMIVVAIIGILAAVAVPAYQDYTVRARFTEVTNQVRPFKLGVEECFQLTGAIAGCSSGANGVPTDITVATGAVGTITTVDGLITATPTAYKGILATDILTFTPSSSATAVVAPVASQKLFWILGGAAVTKGMVKG